MKLFFETEAQASCFLLAVPIGFLLTFFLDSEWIHGWMRIVFDLLLMYCAACALLMLSVFSREEQIRIYHWLGLLLGSVLYLCGIGRIRTHLRMRFRSLRAKMISPGRKKTLLRRTNTETNRRGDVPCAEP